MKKFSFYMMAAALALCPALPLRASVTGTETGDSPKKIVTAAMESRPSKTKGANTQAPTNEIIAATLDSILRANNRNSQGIDAETIRLIVTEAIDSVFRANSPAPAGVTENSPANYSATSPTTVEAVILTETQTDIDSTLSATDYVVEERFTDTDSVTEVVEAFEEEVTYSQKKQRRGFLDKIINSTKIKVDSTQNLDFLYETVIVDNDTIPVVLPQRNYGRYDRGLYNFLFIPRKQWAFGLTASYGEFDTDNIQLFSLISNIDVTIKGYSIKPSIAYFFRHNQSIGLRFDYTRIYGAIDNLYFEYDDDINFNLNGVSYTSNTYSMALFYRNYLGLSKNGRFSIFNEVAFNLGGGGNDFVRNYAGVPKTTHTDTFSMSLDFSPGICVFIQEYVSFNVSFGVFGLHYKHEKQYTDGVYDGTRNTSGANFRFNLFNINFGIGIHI